MDTDTIDMLEEEEQEEALTRPSSWSAALAQLPGFPAEGMVPLPQPLAGAAREVTSALAEDLAAEEEAEVEPL